MRYPLALGDVDGAMDDWSRVMYREPTRSIPEYCARLVERGDKRVAERKYLDAASDFTEALGCPEYYKQALLRRATVHRLYSGGHKALDDLNQLLAADPKYPGAHFQRALTQGRNSAAGFEDLSTAIALNPKDAAALAVRAAAYREREQHELAMLDAEASMALNPADPLAVTERGIGYLYRNEPENAVRDLTDALSKRADEALVRAYRGFAYVMLNQLGAANSDFEAAFPSRQHDWRVLYGRGLVKERSGDVEGAGAAIEKAFAFNGREAVKKKMDLLGLRSAAELWDTCRVRARTAQETIASCTGLIESGRLGLRDLAQAHAYRGYGYNSTSDYGAALTDFTRAIAISPALADGYAGRGYVHYLKNNPVAAIPDLTKAIELGSDRPFLLEHRGAMYFRQEAYQEAVADFTAALAAGSNDHAPYLRGLARQRLGDWKGAEADLLDVTTRHPQLTASPWFLPALPSVPVRTSVSGVNGKWLGCAVYSPPDLESCSSFIREIPLTDSRRRFAHVARAKIYEAQNNHALSIADYTALLEQDEKQWFYRYSRGLEHLRAGDFGSAILDFDLVLYTSANNSRALFARGVARQRSGDAAAGEADFAAALQAEAGVETHMATIGIKRERER